MKDKIPDQIPTPPQETSVRLNFYFHARTKKFITTTLELCEISYVYIGTKKIKVATPTFDPLRAERGESTAELT